MTNKELIELLKGFPEDAEIYVQEKNSLHAGIVATGAEYYWGDVLISFETPDFSDLVDFSRTLAEAEDLDLDELKALSLMDESIREKYRHKVWEEKRKEDMAYELEEKLHGIEECDFNRAILQR